MADAQITNIDVQNAKTTIAAYTPDPQIHVNFLATLKTQYIAAVQNGDTQALAQILANMRVAGVNPALITVP